MRLSNRILKMEASPIRKLVPYADKAKEKGIKVYHLNIGQPDIETPKVFIEEIRKYDEAVLKYANSYGDINLRKSMSKYYKNNNIDLEANDIIITNGGSEGIQLSILSITDEGDNILVPEPFYTNYNGFSMPYSIEIKPITTSPDNGFKLPSREEIEALIDNRTRAILLSNPGNPTGAIYSKEQIEMLADIAVENDIFIISDEVYREFVYDDFEYISFGSIEEIADRVIIIDSISKRFSACGARIGSIGTKNSELIENAIKIAQSRLCAPTLEMIGANALYQLDSSYFTPIKNEYKKRRDFLVQELRKIEGIKFKVPKGAFYVMVELPIEDSEDFAKWLLKDFSYDNKTVMLAPAAGFYATEGLGKNEVRLAYVLNTDDIKIAVDLLKIALDEYSKIKKA